MTVRHCGSCTACCTIMRVAMEPPKPERTKCRFCSAHGCEIYADRPDVCSGFQCLWLASQSIPSHALPLAMRPDRSGVVIDLNAAGTVIAHSAGPASWKREPMRSWLLDHARRTNVIIEIPAGAELLNASGATETLCRIGVDPVTNNRLYVRATEMGAYTAATSEVAA